MKRHALRFMFFCIGMCLSLPLLAKAQMPPGPVTPEAVAQEEVRLFIEEYTKRFSKMDLNTYMDLFSKEAIENRALPYADIREAYRKTIAITDSIKYDVEIYSIQAYAKSAFVSGRYHLTQITKEGRGRTLRGNIQWFLVREGGSLKVKEINYGIDR